MIITTDYLPMARFKDYSYDQHKLLPIAFREQILPSTFEYTLNYLIDYEIDLSVFEGRYRSLPSHNVPLRRN